MSKLRFFKIFLAVAILSIIASVLMVGVSSAASVRITYKYGDFSKDVFVEEGTGFEPLDMSGEYASSIFYGWVDSRGNLYPMDKTVSVTEDTVLYAVTGSEVATEDDIVDAISRGESYVKLTANIGIYSTLSLENGVVVFDTDGYNLTFNSQADAIVGKGSGIVFTGGGNVRHNYMGASPDFTMDSFIKLSPASNLSTLFVTVAEGTSVETPIDFISIATNISRFDSVFNASIYGNLSCNKLMHTRGISGANFYVYNGATVTTGCEYFFEDISDSQASRLVSLHVFGGTFYLNRFNSYAADTSKYQMAITGGYFSEDITSAFPDGNYVFKHSNIEGLYQLDKCNHYGPIIEGMPDSCTTPNVVLTYKCQYCNTVYSDSESFVNGIGHFYVTEVVQPLIVSEEITQEGINQTYCKRCGDIKDTSIIYPNPADVYVTVVYLDDITQKTHSIRVPANMLFDMDPSDPTFLKSFGTEYLSKEYGLQRKNVISVEIPLGITKIYGDQYTHSATGQVIPIGVFYENAHLREVVLPSSVKDVQKNAFRDMKMLTSIKGLENVTGTIATHAFSQSHTNVLIDRATVNATTIGTYAFNNIRFNSLTIGGTVKSIEANAFRLAEDPENGIIAAREVFVEGNTVNGTTVQEAILNTPMTNDPTARRSYSTSGQQFGYNKVVFTEHQCTVEVTVPTCQSAGYTTHTCTICSYVLVDSHTMPLEHKFEPGGQESTCIEGGRTYNICNNCGEIEPGSLVIFDVPNDSHSFTTKPGMLFLDTLNGEDILIYYQSFKTVCGSKNKVVGYYDQYGNLLDTDGYFVCEDTYAPVTVCDRCGIPDYSLAPNSLAQWKSPVGAHDPDMDNVKETVAPTCGDEGVGTAPCTRCSKTIEVILPVSGKNHRWGDPVVTVPATCVSTGEQEFRCTNCKTGVKIGQIEALDPSLRSSHAFDEGKVVREPTETTAGIRLFTCTVEGCDETYTEGINVLIVTDPEFPTWLIIVIIAGGILMVAGTILTLYFTLFKKKRASDSYVYKFNTMGKKK